MAMHACSLAFLLSLCCACFAVNNASDQCYDCDDSQPWQPRLQEAHKNLSYTKIALFGRLTFKPTLIPLKVHDCRIELQAQIVNLLSLKQSPRKARFTVMALQNDAIRRQHNQNAARYAMLLDAPWRGKRRHAKAMVIVHAELACQGAGHTLQGFWAVPLHGQAARLDINASDMSVRTIRHDANILGDGGEQAASLRSTTTTQQTFATPHATSNGIEADVWPSNNSRHPLTDIESTMLSSSCYPEAGACWQGSSARASNATPVPVLSSSSKVTHPNGYLQWTRHVVRNHLLCIPWGRNMPEPAMSVVSGYGDNGFESMCVPWVLVTAVVGATCGLVTWLVCALAYTATAHTPAHSRFGTGEQHSLQSSPDRASDNKTTVAAGLGGAAAHIMRMSGSIAAGAIARASGGIKQAALDAALKWSRDEDGRLKRFSGSTPDGHS